VDFLGSNKVLLNFTTTKVSRPLLPFLGTPDNIGDASTLVGTNTYTGQAHTFTCDKVIVSYSQTATNMAPFAPDLLEEAVFNNVQVFNFWGGEVFLTGNKTNGQFQMINADFTSPFLEPIYPGLLLVQKEYPNLRPAAFLAGAGTQLSNAAILTLLNSQFAQWASYGLLDSWNITDVHYHPYLPHAAPGSLACQPSPTPYNVTPAAHNITVCEPNLYTLLKLLQGHRNTYYTGGLTAYAGTYIVWEHAYHLIQNYFPSQN